MSDRLIELAERLEHWREDSWPDASVCSEAAAALRAMAAQKPTCHCVVDEDGEWNFVTGSANDCHAHINEAINEFQIDGAKRWRVIPLYAAPVPHIEPRGDHGCGG